MAEVDPQPVRLLTDEDESDRGHRLRFIVLGLAVAVAVGFMVYAAFPSNTQYFLTVDEFMAGEEYQDGQMLRVSGKLVADSFMREEGSTQSYFRLTSSVEPAHPQVTASYVGVMPDLFFNPHSEIVLEGRYTPEEVFQTDHILVKCPSKYQALDEAQGQEGLPFEEYPAAEYPASG